VEELHSGQYKLRLRNESGVFESVGRVHIEVPPGKKRKEEEEAKKKKEQEEEEMRRKEEEERRKEVRFFTIF
jgi:ribosomal protein L12E/L44/L45/RPP1/RPP2